MIEERKCALLFAATILAARKLANLSDNTDPTPAKLCAVESNSGKLGDDRNSWTDRTFPLKNRKAGILASGLDLLNWLRGSDSSPERYWPKYPSASLSRRFRLTISP